MATWEMWYIHEGFLIWIIPLTYQSRESIIWACTTSFVHTCIYHMFSVFIACLCVPMLSILFSMHVFRFRFIDIHVFTSFWIYCRSFNFPYVTCHYLYLHVWITSVDYVHVCLICTPLGFIVCTGGLYLTTLDSHVQILEPGPWWPFCSWSECGADHFVATRVQQKLGYRHRSSPKFLSCLALEAPLSAREHLSAFIMYTSLHHVLLYFIF